MKEIGVYLRKERKARKIRLEDIQETTKIRLRYLQAIEEGDLEVIPGEVYRKGFISSYANAIGLDGQEVVEKYNNLKLDQEKQIRLELERVRTGGKKKNQTRDNSSTSESKSETVSEIRSNNSNPKKNIKINIPKFIIALLIVIVLVVALLIPKMIMVNNSSQNKGDYQSTAVNNDETAVKDDQDQNIKDEVATNQLYPAPVTIFADFSERVWVQVKSDGKSVFLENGAVFDSTTPRQVWTAQRQLEIRIGNPAGIKLYFNGEELGQVGERGTPKTIKITTEGLVTP